MTEKVFQKIIKDIKQYADKHSGKNGWLWFFNMHQREVVEKAEELLRLYPKADKKIVLTACWLHDISKCKAKSTKESLKSSHKNHHIDSYEFSKNFLFSYDINNKEITRISQCVLRHRNSAPHKARNIEEKIVAVADTLSHFASIIYFLHFKFYPFDSAEEMVEVQLEKLERDWRDLGLLPKAKKLAEQEYRILKRLFENYEKQ